MKKILLASTIALLTATSTVYAASTAKVKQTARAEKSQKLSAVEAVDVLFKTLRQAVTKSDSSDSMEDFMDSIEMRALMRIISEDSELTIKKAIKSVVPETGKPAYVFEAYDKEGKADVSLIIYVQEVNGKDVYQVLTQNH